MSLWATKSSACITSPRPSMTRSRTSTSTATLLGLRLVKQTVNFDNHNVFHFYYGNETGTPGTIWTTFPYKGWGVPVGRKGAGQIAVTSFSVPVGSLDPWRHRLEPPASPSSTARPISATRRSCSADPSGLMTELVATSDDDARAVDRRRRRS